MQALHRREIFDIRDLRYLRAFRDNDLARTAMGREFVRLCYRMSPALDRLIADPDRVLRRATGQNTTGPNGRFLFWPYPEK